MTNEMWVACIGAAAAVIGAIISTFSIVLTNKNTKQLKLLERSESVKTTIAATRYGVYNKIIDYINSWYDVDTKLDYKYSACPAKKYMTTTIFEHRLKTVEDIKTEIKKVEELSINYFYLDGQTYKLLKALENYLSTAANVAYTKDIKNPKFFFYVVYHDVWRYIFKISKRVNRFIKGNDTLKFKPSNSVKQKFVGKLLEKTDFYRIYYHAPLIKEIEEIIQKQIPPRIKECNQAIEDGEKFLANRGIDKKKRHSVKKNIRILKQKKRWFSKQRIPKKLARVKRTKTYSMWEICKGCDNKNCVLSAQYQSHKSVETTSN